jgi:MFS family permease
MVSLPERRRILVVSCGCLMVVIAGVTALNLVLPTLALDLGLTQTVVHWVADGYAVTLAALLLPAGALGDRFGRRPALLVGLGMLATCSLMSAFMTSGGAIVGLRVGAGVGAALAMPVTLATITGVYPTAQRQQAVTIWAATAAAGGMLGFLVAGATLDRWGWGASFVVLAAGAALSMVVAAFVIPDTADPAHAPSDPLGTVLSVASLGWFAFAVIEGPARGWTSAAIVGAFAVSAAAAVTWIAVELRTSRPMLDPRLFRRGQLAASTLSLTVQFFTTFGFLYVGVQYFLLVLGDSTLEAGARFVPMAVGVASMTVVAQPITDRFGRAAAGAMGLAILGVATAGFAATRPDMGSLPIVLAFVGFGFGLGLSSATATSTIVDGFANAQQGVASAVNDTAREFGAAVGIAVLGSAMNAGYRNGMQQITELMPQDLADIARDSPSAAFVIAEQAGAEGAPLAVAASDALTTGMSVATGLGAVVAFLAAALLWRGRHQHTSDPSPSIGALSRPSTAHARSWAGSPTFR